MVRQGSAKPLCAGSIPAQASGSEVKKYLKDSPNKIARVAELADAIDLRSIAARRVGSTPTPGTVSEKVFLWYKKRAPR